MHTIDKLIKLGAKVIYGKDKGIHVSGHGCQEDQKWMLGLTRPKYFIPVHGEYRMQVLHGKTAVSMGVHPENVLVMENGDVAELRPDSLIQGSPVKSGVELLDSSRTGVVDTRVLKERQQLADDGVITVLTPISTDGVMVAPPRVNLRGVITNVDAKTMVNWTEREINWVLENRWKQLVLKTGGKSVEVDWIGLQREVEAGLSRRLRREVQAEPLILCLVQPAPSGTRAYKPQLDQQSDSRQVIKKTVEPTSKATSASVTNKETSSVSEQKTKSESNSDDMPSGRTRRRRSAIS
tara:strand:- start:393 stop:1274 length:882 start_codon:yes stop_codon:yes gene_type:complete